MSYSLGRQFILRMTGFPVEAVTALNRPALAERADAVLAERATAEDARQGLLTKLRDGPRKLRRAVERGEPVTLDAGDPLGEAVRPYSELQAAWLRAR